MQKHFTPKGVEEFSWTRRWRGSTTPAASSPRNRRGTLKQTDVYLFRSPRCVQDYAVHGAVLRRYNRSVSKLDAAGTETIDRFQAHLCAAGRSASTVRTYGTPGRGVRRVHRHSGRAWAAVTPP